MRNLKIRFLRFKKNNRKAKKVKKDKKHDTSYLVWSAIFNLILAIAVILGLFIAEPIRQFDFEPGKIAEETITATRDIVDEYTTQILKDEAINSVLDIYAKDNKKTDEIYINVTSGIGHISTVYDSVLEKFDKWKQGKIDSLIHPGEPDPEWTENSPEYIEYENALKQYQNDEKYYSDIELKDLLADDNLYDQAFPNSFWNQLISSIEFYYLPEELHLIARTSATDIGFLENDVASIIFAKVEAGIKQSELEGVVSDIKERISSYGYNANSNVMRLVDVVVSHVTYNVFLDVEATEAARNLAAESVEPIFYKRGQIIITAGQPITEAQYRLIDELGLLVSGANDYSGYIAMSIAILLMCGMLFAIFVVYRRSTIINVRFSILITVLCIVSMGLYIVFKPLNQYVCTPLIAVMLTAMLINGKTAIMIGIPLSVFAGMYSGGDFSVTFAFLVAGILCSCLMSKATASRSMVLVVGLLSSVAQIVAVMSMEYYTTAKLAMLGANAFWILMGGLVSGILAVGLLTLFELPFSVITPIRLLELSNQSQPLLRRLQIEAAGTYHHSIIVGNLAETAANEIGANGLLARVGSYYHDIGKLARPQMFKENQPDGYNPHDSLPPEESAKIIIDHVSSGLRLATENRVPAKLKEFIGEHHGNAIAYYFYVEACNRYGKENVNIDDYRYGGTMPTSKETAIVMLADTVEAAVRSMKTHSYEDIQQMVDKLVKDKIDAGMLNNCPLTFAEVITIKKSFMMVLSGTYHSRVEYPKLKEAENE